MITTIGNQLSGDCKIDANTGLSHIALGIGTTPPAAGDSKLGNEQVRKVMAYRTRAGTTTYYTAFFPRDTCNFYIREVGIFGGATATLTKDSGKLYERLLYDYDNSEDPQDITVEYSITEQEIS